MKHEEWKKKALEQTAKVINVAAWGGGGLPTWFGFYEPELPEKMKKQRNNNQPANKKSRLN